jgi:hypothetical protein
MKNQILRNLFCAVLALAVVAVLGVGHASAQAETDGKFAEGAGRLDGTWNVELTVRNCLTDAPLRTLPELYTFMDGGTVMTSTSGQAPSLRTAGQGTWKHIGNTDYSFTAKAFRFDAAGAFIGWFIFRQSISLDWRASGFTSRGTLEIYDAAGNQTFSGCSTTVGERFE